MADPCSCLDSAYERRAVEQGLNLAPVFPENKQYLKELQQQDEQQSQTLRTCSER